MENSPVLSKNKMSFSKLLQQLITKTTKGILFRKQSASQKSQQKPQEYQKIIINEKQIEDYEKLIMNEEKSFQAEVQKTQNRLQYFDDIADSPKQVKSQKRETYRREQGEISPKKEQNISQKRKAARQLLRSRNQQIYLNFQEMIHRSRNSQQNFEIVSQCQYNKSPIQILNKSEKKDNIQDRLSNNLQAQSKKDSGIKAQKSAKQQGNDSRFKRKEVPMFQQIRQPGSSQPLYQQREIQDGNQNVTKIQQIVKKINKPSARQTTQEIRRYKQQRNIKIRLIRDFTLEILTSNTGLMQIRQEKMLVDQLLEHYKKRLMKIIQNININKCLNKNRLINNDRLEQLKQLIKAISAQRIFNKLRTKQSEIEKHINTKFRSLKFKIIKNKQGQTIDEKQLLKKLIKSLLGFFQSQLIIYSDIVKYLLKNYQQFNKQMQLIQYQFEQQLINQNNQQDLVIVQNLPNQSLNQNVQQNENIPLNEALTVNEVQNINQQVIPIQQQPLNHSFNNNIQINQVNNNQVDTNQPLILIVEQPQMNSQNGQNPIDYPIDYQDKEFVLDQSPPEKQSQQKQQKLQTPQIKTKIKQENINIISQKFNIKTISKPIFQSQPQYYYQKQQLLPRQNQFQQNHKEQQKLQERQQEKRLIPQNINQTYSKTQRVKHIIYRLIQKTESIQVQEQVNELNICLQQISKDTARIPNERQKEQAKSSKQIAFQLALQCNIQMIRNLATITSSQNISVLKGFYIQFLENINQKQSFDSLPRNNEFIESQERQITFNHMNQQQKQYKVDAIKLYESNQSYSSSPNYILKKSSVQKIIQKKRGAFYQQQPETSSLLTNQDWYTPPKNQQNLCQVVLDSQSSNSAQYNGK